MGSKLCISKNRSQAFFTQVFKTERASRMKRGVIHPIEISKKKAGGREHRVDDVGTQSLRPGEQGLKTKTYRSDVVHGKRRRKSRTRSDRSG